MSFVFASKKINGQNDYTLNSSINKILPVLELWNVNHERTRSIDLSEILLQPFDLYEVMFFLF